MGVLGIENGVNSGAGDPNGFSPVWTDQGFIIPLGQLPEFSSVIVAVDPEAEQALLGDERAVFLDPLREAPEGRDLGSSVWSDLVDPDAFTVPFVALQEAESEVADPTIAVPLVVAQQPATNIVTRIDIAVAEAAIDEVPLETGAIREIIEQADFEQLESVTLDVSGLSTPFSTPSLFAEWPGSEWPDDEGNAAFTLPATELEPLLTGRPRYEPLNPTTLTDDRPAFALIPGDIVDPAGTPVAESESLLQGSGTEHGVVRAYREATPAGGPGLAGALPAPLGTFVPQDIADPDFDEVSYVPSGVYHAGVTERLEGGIVEPNLSGLDFITSMPGAFTDLDGGASLRGDTPIDAVRVRITGIEAYTPANQARVLAVTEEISALGLQATVVAGSSPQPVALYVPDYYPDRMGDEADLGWVSQEWTTLGAAVHVETAFTGLTVTLAVGVLAAVGIGVLVTSVHAGRGRRGEVAVLHAVGWSRDSIVRRLALREVVPTVLVVLMAAVTAYLTTASARPGILTLAAVTLVAAALSIPISLAKDSSVGARRRSRSRRREPATTVGAIVLRRVIATPTTTLLAVGGTAVLAILAALTTAAVTDQLAAAGATRLADTVRDSSVVFMALLGLVGMFASVLLLSLGRSMQLRQQRAQERALTRIGFDIRMRAAIVRREDAVIAVLCAVSGFVVAGCALLSLSQTAALAAVTATAIAILSRSMRLTGGMR
ncbi:hypothetical protein [uncultured Agrococcus sp.]|uniref:hypothetical protein n=1 Tax=uncultured Agrococcus sp. TaxID=382258 RepID=UPI0025E6400F|nr:hypothetical protein [uncultured Agrococcus sp.]